MAHAPAGEHDVDIGPGPPARHHHGRPRDRPGELDRAAGGLRSDQAWTPGTHQCARTWRILASEHFRSSDREGLWRWMWADCGRRSAADGTGSARMRVERPAAGRSSAPVRERRRRGGAPANGGFNSGERASEGSRGERVEYCVHQGGARRGLVRGARGGRAVTQWATAALRWRPG